MRRFRWDKKYLYWGVTAFLVIAAAIVFYMIVSNLTWLGQSLRKFGRILSPFVWGLVIAYLLYPLMRIYQRGMFEPLWKLILKKSKKADTLAPKLARGCSVFLAMISLLVILTGLVWMVAPQMYTSIETIIVNSPVYIDSLTTWVTKLLTDFPEIRSYVTQVMGDVNTDLMSWLQTTVLPGLGSLLSNVGTGVKYLLTGLYNLIIGIIVSVYILGDSETFGANAKRLLYSLLTPEAAKKLLEGLDFTNRTFIGFLNGKLLDSAIIGLICYIVCAILDMPYALLVSVIIGLTNIIPFFGPFIGAVPSAIIILMVSPIKCLIFVVFIIILQQVDGNLIGPKILGSSVGINGFWVMFSIILGAGLFSFWGMLLGVPVFVLIYTLINNSVDRKLRRSDLPVTTEEFMEIDYIDPVTLKPVPHEKGEN